jgi:hypothetical protein
MSHVLVQKAEKNEFNAQRPECTAMLIILLLTRRVLAGGIGSMI